MLELRNASPKDMRSQFGVVMERTCNELRGISCLDLADVAPPKQQIISSRSFGTPVESIGELGEAVATYVARAAEKLRRQGSAAGAVHVFVQTNPFKASDLQYNTGRMVPLPHPSDDTFDLTQAALLGLKAIYRRGYKYKKAGIMLTLISDKSKRQESLFDDPVAREKSKRLMAAMDVVNHVYGRDTVRSAASGTKKRWVMRSENRSPRYTTRWDELPYVH